jgi:plastocyanin
MIGWGIAVVIVAIMGALVAHGPFHNIAKTAAAPVGKPVSVKMITDPKTIGAYVPHSVTVHVGQEVIFDNVSNAPHTVTANDQSFNSSNIAIGASWTFIPKKTGTYQYNCIYHPLMHGILVVTS